MATVNKDFKIKSGLIVEGTTATVNGYDILTKKTDDQNYIIGLIGGSATSNATPNTVVLRDGAGSFSANVITASVFNGDLYGNAGTATALETSRMISLTGDVTGAVFFDGSANAQITTTIDGAFATDEEVSDAVAQGVADAADDATTKANTAYDNAVSMANTLALYAQGNAYAYADGLAGNYEAAGAAANALADANSYTDNAVAALVDGAPELLDTLNELAEALQDNPNVISTIQDVAAGKQDALTAGNGIDIDGSSNITVDPYDLVGSAGDANYIELGVKNGDIAIDKSFLTQYTDTLYDATGAAADALANANSYTDNAIANLDLAFTTDEVEEGEVNEYFTDARAKTSAADLLTGATLANITITGDGTGLTITAENGVDDSTTDDLEEGETNLYFTDERVIDAVDNADITPNTVTIDTFRKEEATQQVVASASTVEVHGLQAPYESVKYLVRVVGEVSGTKHSQITEILMTVDGNNNIAITEYGMVHTSENPLATFSATMTGGASQYPALTATTAVNGCEIIAAATMLSWDN